MKVKIIDDLAIESVLLITLKGAIWPEQGLLRMKSAKELGEIIAKATSENPTKYLFTPLGLAEAYYVSLRGVRIGNRLDRGPSGKLGKHFPIDACGFFLKKEDAAIALGKLSAYFEDLAANSIHGQKSKHVGEIKANHFLFV